MKPTLSFGVKNLCIALVLNALACGVIGHYAERGSGLGYLGALALGICLLSPLPVWFFLFRKADAKPSPSRLFAVAFTISFLTYIFLLLPNRPEWVYEPRVHGVVTIGFAVLTAVKRLSSRASGPPDW